jgi:uncharacterized membrane protein HdeD (DUF308 family)
MTIHDSYHWRRQLVWGLLLIGAGVAIFLDRMDLVDIDTLWHYWPLLLVVSGINRTIGYPTARDFTSGLWTAFIGIWLFVCMEGLFGMTFANSWPVFIIISGVTMALRPFAERRFKANQESGHEMR